MAECNEVRNTSLTDMGVTESAALNEEPPRGGGSLEDGEIVEPENEGAATRREIVDAIVELRNRMDALEQNMTWMESKQDTKTISKRELESMIKRAIKAGPDYGVGKGFIKNHLIHQLQIPDSQHYVKRMNETLRSLTMRKELIFDSQFQLYRLK